MPGRLGIDVPTPKGLDQGGPVFFRADSARIRRPGKRLQGLGLLPNRVVKRPLRALVAQLPLAWPVNRDPRIDMPGQWIYGEVWGRLKKVSENGWVPGLVVWLCGGVEFQRGHVSGRAIP